jgi:hypothetical protein
MSKMRIFALFLLVAVSPLMTEPLEASDREDPIQVGYVIVTPLTDAGAPVQEETGALRFRDVQ